MWFMLEEIPVAYHHTLNPSYRRACTIASGSHAISDEFIFAKEFLVHLIKTLFLTANVYESPRSRVLGFLSFVIIVLAFSAQGASIFPWSERDRERESFAYLIFQNPFFGCKLFSTNAAPPVYTTSIFLGSKGKATFSFVETFVVYLVFIH